MLRVRPVATAVVTSVVLLAASAAVGLRAQTPAQPPAQQPPAQGQPPAGQPPAGQPTAQPAAPAPADPMRFSSDSMLLMFVVTQEGAPEFESLLTKVKDALAKSDKPERKAQAAHWKVVKVNEMQNGMVQYMCLIDQVAKDQTYDPFRILGEAGMTPQDVRALYDKIGPTLKSVNPIAVTHVIDMGNPQ